MSAKLYKGVATFEFYFLSSSSDVEAHARSIAVERMLYSHGLTTATTPIVRLEELPEQDRNEEPYGDTEWKPCGNETYTIAEWFARQEEEPSQDG